MCLCVLGREKQGEEREKEKAIVVIMIPSGSEGWADYEEGGDGESVGDLQSDDGPRLQSWELTNWKLQHTYWYVHTNRGGSVTLKALGKDKLEPSFSWEQLQRECKILYSSRALTL